MATLWISSRKCSRGVAVSRGSSGLDRRGTCAPPPFYVTGGQPAMGQGVVVHTQERDLLRYLTLPSSGRGQSVGR
ncbi:unnamed protein product [Spirodela intermedia]|uniref:Uncharacterized protein n=1 Tax=Spirodela intermedia TaxID=51605 RepID=A0A7I8IVP6_SPIIN|nr:unnamed protein product [Spirodela intermedia]CAA6662067.1 unnamed protein product [Spirodela intermedia]